MKFLFSIWLIELVKYSEWPGWIEIDPIMTRCDPIQKENWHNFEKKLSEYFLENFFWKVKIINDH